MQTHARTVELLEPLVEPAEDCGIRFVLHTKRSEEQEWKDQASGLIGIMKAAGDAQVCVCAL